ncbi:hypothetical protein BJ166DRAFT_197431 [Pestalotiopsis sp. NC0098]|nr:hypothetical protein BJ166DRAFT_197431 [Pestalotiopsis sp. NC0098]
MQPSQDDLLRRRRKGPVRGPVSSRTRSMTESAYIHPSRFVNFTTAPIPGAGEITGKVQSSEDAVGNCQSEQPCTGVSSAALDLGPSQWIQTRVIKEAKSQKYRLSREEKIRELEEARPLLASEVDMDEKPPCGICNQISGPHNCPQVASSSANPKFIVKHYLDAAFFAAEVANPNWMPNKPRLVFYADGSGARGKKNSRVAGAGITYKRVSNGNVSDWTDSSRGIICTTRADPSELYAVWLALKAAVNELEATHKSSREAEEQDDQATLRLLFITDSQSAMLDVHDYISSGTIAKGFSRDTFRELMQPLIRLKEFNVPFEFHWVPGHMGIEGNSRADALATVAARWTLSRLSSIAEPAHSEYQVVQIPKLDEQALVNLLGSQKYKRAAEKYVGLGLQDTKCISEPKNGWWSEPAVPNLRPPKRKAALDDEFDPRPSKRMAKMDEALDQQDLKWNSTPEENWKSDESGFMQKIRAGMAKHFANVYALWKRPSDTPSREL